MAQHSHQSSIEGRNPRLVQRDVSGQRLVFERLESRQMLSSAVMMASQAALGQFAVPSSVHVSAPQDQAKLDAKMAQFQTHLENEVGHHPHLAESAAFQQRIADEQTKFATRMAKLGATYTPVSFEDLATTYATNKATKLAADIAAAITAFEQRLHKEVRTHHNASTNLPLQKHIATEQAHFAAHITKMGGSYTVIPFSNLLGVGTDPNIPIVTGTSVSTTEIDLTWPAITAALAYKVESSTDSGTTWITLGTPATNSYNDFGLTADTSYQYRVSTILVSGTTAPSTIVTKSTLLNAPAGLTAVTASATRINLTWNVVTHATTYKIERSTNGTTWTTLTPLVALIGSSTSYGDINAAAGTSYYYRISATGGAGTSAPSGLRTAMTLPAAPVLTATPISATEIDLHWTAVTSAFSYKLETSINGGATWSVLTTSFGVSFAHTGLTADSTHKYRLSAINGAGTSLPSAVITQTAFPGSPTGFAASPASTTAINLSWIPVTHSTSYKIERSLNNTTWTVITPGTALTHSSISYADTGLTAGTTYYYRLSTVDAVGTSVACTAVHALTLPVAPTVTGTVTSGTAIALSWPAVTSATGYKVETSSNGGTSWTTLAASQAGLTYAHTSLAANSSHKYRVTAINATGVSAASTVVTLVTLSAAPTGLSAVSTSATAIHIAWLKVTGATSYKLERSPDNTTWTTVVPGTAFTGTTVSYNDTTVVGGTTYYYRLSSISTVGTSSAATAVHALTFPAAPVVTATVISATAITINWPAVTGATAYMIEGSSNGGSSWTTLVSSQATITYAHSGLVADSPYSYRVTAINATGSSAASSVASAITLLTAPTNLAATVSSATSVHLIWTPVTDATSYKLERSTNNTTWSTVTPGTPFTGSSASYDDNSVAAGTTYYYRLSAVDASGTSTASAAVNVLTFPAVATLTGVVASATTINLSWTAVVGATTYLVETSADGGTTWTTLATQSGITYSHTGLTADTAHKYRVSVNNASGTSAASSVVSLTTMLAAPAGFTATVTSPTNVNLAWTVVTDATTYKIERSANAGSTWSTLVPGTPLTGSSNSYADATALAGTSYLYRISATNTVGTSAASASITALTLPAAPVPTAVANSVSQITLSWPAVTGAATYKIEFSSDGGTTWAVQATQAGVSYIHTGLIVDTSYKYRVTAVNATGNSAVSAVVTMSTLLAPPTGFNATITAATTITLGWNAVTDATTYKIERSTDNVTFTTVVPGTPLTGSSTSYADTVLAGTSYYYRISAVDAAGTSTATAAVHATTVPAAPVLTATLISATQINLSWTASTGATSYKLESSPDGSTWTALVSQSTLTFNNTGLTPDTAHHYRVFAINASGSSAASNLPATITTLLAPPAGFAAAVTTSTNINLTWTAVTDATSYKIERSLDNATWVAIVPGTPFTGSSAAYSDASVLAGTQYFYRISASNTVGSSVVSATVPALTLTATPTLTATVASATRVDLSWTAVQSAHSYKVESSPDGTTWTVIATPVTTTYSDTGLTADTLYKYRVSGVNATGPSVASAVQTVTTVLVSPAGVAAAATSASRIAVSWTAETHATSYQIERSTDNVNWTTLVPGTPLTGTDVLYADTTVAAGTTYYYRVSSIDANGTSAPAATVHALTMPAAPVITGVVFSSTQINLSWNAVKGATGYTIDTFDGSAWNPLLTQPVGTATTFSNTGLTPDTAYIYAVFATDATGDGALSLSSLNLTTTLSAPASFAVAATSATSTHLTWTAAAHATDYLLERSTDNATWSTITPGTPWSSSSAAYTDSTVIAGTTYYYRLAAIDAAGTSAKSTGNALTNPAAPALAGVSPSATQLNLSWAAMKSATSYTLEAFDGTSWAAVSPGPVGAVTSYNVTGLTADTAYTYRLTTNNATGASAVSSSLVATTRLAAPASLVASSTTATSAHLAWTANADATSYKLERSLDNTIWTTLVQSPVLDGTSAAYTDSAVVAGTRYYYRLSGINTNGTSATSTANILTRPAAPTLTGTVGSATVLNLAWNAVKSATSYTLEAFDGTSWAAVSPGPVGAVTSYAVTSLTADTAYTYRLTANNATGASVVSSSLVLTTALAAPASFTVAATSATSIHLTWTANADATSYKLERSTDNTIFTTITPGTPWDATSAAYTDSTVVAGTTYYYRLSAIDASGTSAASTGSALTNPAAPTLTAEVASSTSLVLTWTDTLSATSYTLESFDGTSWSAVSPAPVGTANTITLTSLTPDTAYTYRVAAVNATGSSAVSSTVVVSTSLSAPASFAAAATTATNVHLTWTANAHATAYLLERSDNGTIWTTITPSPVLDGTSSSCNDTTAVAGTTYQYRLSAINAAGTSDPATPVTVLTKPAAPTLTGVVASATELDLSWTPVQSATSYTLESFDGSSWAAVSPAPVGTVTDYAVTGLTADTAYTYRISANNATGASVVSSSLVITTLLAPPSDLAAAATSATSVHLTWTAVTHATTYTIEQSTDNSTWTTLVPGTPLTGSSASYNDTTVTAGNTYFYRITATNLVGNSVPGSSITVTTPLAAPVGLAAVVNSATQITLSWTLDTDDGLTGYRLESSLNGTSWSTVATLDPTVTTTANTGLTTSTAYHYRLFALSAGGDSAASTPVVATTA